MMKNLQIPEGLNKTSFASIIDQYDSFFFDCDGVLFNGSNYLAPTYEALNKLKELGKNVFFVTNSSKNSRRYMFDRIKVGGFEPDVDKIFTSSYLAAKYLNINHPNVTKVYVIGLEGLKDELEQQNIQVVGGQEDTNKDMSVSQFDDLVVDDDIQAVVVGVDYGFNYYKLVYASIALQKGALFIATNLDANIKMAKFKMPGGGCMVKALEHSCDIKPYIVGKPNPDVIDVAIKSYGLDRKRCLMIGDRLDTDVMLGKNAGIDTFAVLTGVTSEKDLFKEAQGENPNLPTYYWERVEI